MDGGQASLSNSVGLGLRFGGKYSSVKLIYCKTKTCFYHKWYCTEIP